MNYTKTLRTYCLQNKGKIFDVGKMAEDYFPMIPYKTLLKVLKRLEDEEILTSVSKGVYYINSVDSSNIDEAIIDYYVGNSHGMIIGDAMCYEQGISQTKPDTIELYTNMISTNHKNVGKYKMTYANLRFGERTREIVQALEAIENGDKYKIIYYEKYADLIEKGIKNYADWELEDIADNIHYEYATMVTLSEALKAAGISNQKCMEIVMNSRAEK